MPLPLLYVLHTHTQETGAIRFVVLVVYVGGDKAATLLVDTAETDLNQIASLITNVGTQSNGAITVQQVGAGGVQPLCD